MLAETCNSNRNTHYWTVLSHCALEQWVGKYTADNSALSCLLGELIGVLIEQLLDLKGERALGVTASAAQNSDVR